MACITYGSSFLTGSPMMHGSCERDRECGHSRCRVVSCESSTAYGSNSQMQNAGLKSSAEEGGVQKILKNSAEKRNWFAPLFNFSSDGMWSSISPEAQKQVIERVPVAAPGAGVASFQGESNSPDLTGSSNRVPDATPAAGVTLIQGGSTSLPDLIASSQWKPKADGKQVIFDDKKARELRKQLRGHETWHDGWVHSAIATRLAIPEE